MNNLAIIPARGGSKRIPRKNIRPFAGRPILAYSIEAALQSGLFSEVMVSTDDAEIAEIALRYGATVPFMRSPENANDFAPTLAVIQEVLQQYEPRRFDLGCCIYATAPLIQPAQLKDGLQLLQQNDYDVVFPVVAFSYPVWRALNRNPDGKTKMQWPEYQMSRSQDLSPLYHDAGQWYWFNPQRISTGLFTSNTGTIVLSEDQVQDIDTPTDWRLAEMKYHLLSGTHDE